MQACFLEKSLDRCKKFQERSTLIVLIHPVEVPAKNLQVLNMGFTLLLRFGGGEVGVVHLLISSVKRSCGGNGGKHLKMPILLVFKSGMKLTFLWS